MEPQKLDGSRYQVLRIRNTFTVFTTNGVKRLIENIHYYGPGAGQCGPNAYAWSQSQKVGLVQYSAGANGYYGFQTLVALALNAVLNKAALPGGIFAKWLDVPTDFDAQVGTLAPSTVPPTTATVGNGSTTGGGIGTLITRMPLDNHVTMRKATGIAGREWSRGRWKFAPIDEAHVEGDELNAAAQILWAALKAPMYAPITDGSLTGTTPNLLYPILVSSKLSQLRREPTRIAYTPLILPGLQYNTQQTNAVINATIGEQKRRKERPDVVF